MVGIKMKIGPKGQVVIPKQLRDELSLHTNDTVQFELEDNKIILTKSAKKDPIKLLLEVKRLATRKITKADLKKIDWHKLYEEQFEHRNKLKK